MRGVIGLALVIHLSYEAALEGFLLIVLLVTASKGGFMRPGLLTGHLPQVMGCHDF